MKYNLNMMATVDKLLEIGRHKQNLLHICIARHEEEICRLRDGGKMVQGRWVSDNAFSEMVNEGSGGLTGEYDWDAFIAAGLVGGTRSDSTSEVSEEEKGKSKGEGRPRFNPNAVGTPQLFYKDMRLI